MQPDDWDATVCKLSLFDHCRELLVDTFDEYTKVSLDVIKSARSSELKDGSLHPDHFSIYRSVLEAVRQQEEI
jgi:LmbE family N-acetylglucosaminyl deacetylase